MGDGDPIVKALQRSTIAKTLKAARASLADPSRPFTPLDRSLFQLPNAAGAETRPTSSYGVDDVTFVRDIYGGRSESALSNRPETIVEEAAEHGRNRSVDVWRIADEEEDDDVADLNARRPSPYDSEVCGSPRSSGSDGEVLTPMEAACVSAPAPSRPHARPPRAPGASGYPGSPAGAARGSGGYPAGVPVIHLSPARRPRVEASPHRHRVSDGSPRHRVSDSSPRRHVSDSSPRRRKKSASPAPVQNYGGASGSTPPATARRDWDRTFEAVIEKLHAFALSKEGRRSSNEILLHQMCDRIWDLVVDIKVGKGSSSNDCAPRLLREVMSLMDLKELKDAKWHFKLSKSALTLLQMEGATAGVRSSGVQAAYLNIAQVLFKYSQREGNDDDFLQEGLLEPILQVLQAQTPECLSNDLRVYLVGVLKNASHADANQQHLAQHGAVSVLFNLVNTDRLMGSSKEAQLLIQITATLRNLASNQYRQFIHEERLGSLTKLMSLFPGHVELLTNLARIMAKLTLHKSACEAFTKSDAYLRQIVKTMSANLEVPPLVLRLAFVLGNLTERSERLRLSLAFGCEGTALVPQLLGHYWQQDRKLARLELEKGQVQISGSKEIEEVLVKLVRLLANVSINTSAGPILAASSAVVDPLLDMFGAKRIGDSEELVLNVVAAITNLLFYDEPSNLLFHEEHKPLQCRLFRPLLLESYNIEALIETARALGNLSRHADVRQCMVSLRLDEILVILLDHEDRDLVFYVCGALVNLGADPTCISRLLDSTPLLEKLSRLLTDAPRDDLALQLVAVKALTNLAMDSAIGWPPQVTDELHTVLEQTAVSCTLGAASPSSSKAAKANAADRQQLQELAENLMHRLPTVHSTSEHLEEKAEDDSCMDRYQCDAEGCGRTFRSEDQRMAHALRRHGTELLT
mmetsp:Transcript_103040/g.204529  ORF Transcript_103040/g.204529 Transcript_103040/m.204529 type:complete len:920 (+) Transcript_103040:163-2922(+)|eukprot:CAMPEP_0172831334 /NCGR_PEP_ID=MMETSP1075-20121228/22902_1 /TAXON_ID=2916 /ORGANISM="Ceratium fusus, Strain PA161109" /LENGTH=919 /DNA_ID=CAMNT_0013673793 /DNA_START=83 /DNA_END=2842 /DNA_ORIENTATION=+